MRLEQERFKQQQRLRLEQIRLEEERKKHEKLQAERNALYNRQRLDMEAQFFSGGEGDRQHRETVQATASTTPEVREKEGKRKMHFQYVAHINHVHYSLTSFLLLFMLKRML